MTPPIRLLAVDIDGTLVDSTFQVPAANLAALRRAHELGIEVVLTTGRRHHFALPIAKLLGFEVPLISSNGAITRSSRGELFHRDLMPADIARRLAMHMSAFRPYTVVTFDVEGRGAVVIESSEELNARIARWMELNAAFIREVRPLEAAFVVDPVQMMFCGTIARMNHAGAHLQAFDGLAEITVLKTEYIARDLCLLDILNKDCSKGHALRRWAEHRGLTREQVMAIGDNYNDVEMLAYAGFPVIMGNACEELKQNGWRVTASNDEGGVAAALAEIGVFGTKDGQLQP